MTATVDKFGRIVIPKPIRDSLGMGPGSRVRVVEESGHVAVYVESEEPSLRYEDGVLVYDGEAEGDLGNAIAKDRENRRRRNSRGL